MITSGQNRSPTKRRDELDPKKENSTNKLATSFRRHGTELTQGKDVRADINAGKLWGYSATNTRRPMSRSWTVEPESQQALRKRGPRGPRDDFEILAYMNLPSTRTNWSPLPTMLDLQEGRAVFGECWSNTHTCASPQREQTGRQNIYHLEALALSFRAK